MVVCAKDSFLLSSAPTNWISIIIVHDGNSHHPNRALSVGRNKSRQNNLNVYFENLSSRARLFFLDIYILDINIFFFFVFASRISMKTSSAKWCCCWFTVYCSVRSRVSKPSSQWKIHSLVLEILFILFKFYLFIYFSFQSIKLKLYLFTFKFPIFPITVS